jgi:hypothetical protein
VVTPSGRVLLWLLPGACNVHCGTPTERAATAVQQSGECELTTTAACTASSDPTCVPFDPPTWEVVVERTFEHSGAGVGAPIALPGVDEGAQPWILLRGALSPQGDDQEGSGAVIALEGSTFVPHEYALGVDPDAFAMVGARPSDPVIESAATIATVGSMVDAGVIEFQLQCLGTNPPTTTTFDAQQGYPEPSDDVGLDTQPGVTDWNRDGAPDFLTDEWVLDDQCQPLGHLNSTTSPNSNFTTLVMQSQEGEPIAVTSEGMSWAVSGRQVAWSEPIHCEEGGNEIGWFAGSVLGIEGVPTILATAEIGLFRSSIDGLIEVVEGAGDARTCTPRPSPVFSAGDVDGDGLPEGCVSLDGDFYLIDHNLVELDPLPSGDPYATRACVLADLDARVGYEIILYGSQGLSIIDGATLSVLSTFDDITSTNPYTSPIVADIDGDGSAEIVVPGSPKGEGSDTHLYALGPASGRWARTRPVWNQHGYDPTTIRDDGTIISFPRPNWQTYNSFRAQPAHDGDRPDLAPRVDDVCIDTCAVGTYRVAVVVENLGSQPAPAGTEVVFSTWTEGDLGLTEVARQTIDAEIGSRMAAASVVFDIPTSQWGDRRVVDVYGAHDDECDLVNDRIDVWEDPCPG